MALKSKFNNQGHAKPTGFSPDGFFLKNLNRQYWAKRPRLVRYKIKNVNKNNAVAVEIKQVIPPGRIPAGAIKRTIGVG